MSMGKPTMVKHVSITTRIETAPDADADALCRRFDYFLRDARNLRGIPLIPYELQRAILDVKITDVQITSNPAEI